MSAAAIELTQAFKLNSTIWVNLCAMCFGLCAVPASFVSIWAFKNLPTGYVLRASSLAMFLGAITRMGSFYKEEIKFWPILTGTIICACACPFFVNVQSVIANKWFSDKERALATAI